MKRKNVLLLALMFTLCLVVCMALMSRQAQAADDFTIRMEKIDNPFTVQISWDRYNDSHIDRPVYTLWLCRYTDSSKTDYTEEEVYSTTLKTDSYTYPIGRAAFANYEYDGADLWFVRARVGLGYTWFDDQTAVFSTGLPRLQPTSPYITPAGYVRWPVDNRGGTNNYIVKIYKASGGSKTLVHTCTVPTGELYNGEIEHSYFSGNMMSSSSAYFAEVVCADSQNYYVRSPHKTTNTIQYDPHFTGWYTSPMGRKTYYSNGDPVSNTFYDIDNRRYHFNRDGIMETGWQTINGKRYYFGTDGAAATGFRKIGSKTYYFGTDNVMAEGFAYAGRDLYYFMDGGPLYEGTGWVEIDDQYYYFDDNNVIRRGLFAADGKKYYSDDYFGTRCTGPVTIAGDLYYFDETTGEMTSGLKQVSGRWYNFGTDGRGTPASGWVQSDGIWYYVKNGESVKNEWIRSSDKWYYLRADGVMATGRMDIDWEGKHEIFGFDPTGAMVTGWQYMTSDDPRLGKFLRGWYYFDPNNDGCAVTGWKQIGGKWYYFKNTGVMQTGWQTIDGKIYCLDPVNGDMFAKTGWQQLSGKWYYFEASGAAKTGWYQSGGKWYYFDPSTGAMLTGTQKISGKMYLLDPVNGDMFAKTGWQQVNGKWYYFESTGAMKTGWFQTGGKWYYLDPNTGVMATGWKQVNGKWYYLDKTNGDMQTGWFKDTDGSWYYLDPRDGYMWTSGTVDGWKIGSNGVAVKIA